VDNSKIKDALRFKIDQIMMDITSKDHIQAER
jgi:hypothetical protein